MLSVTFLWSLVGLAFAPFPPEHQYNFLNPVIDPWWHKLDKSTQTAVYSVWEAKEPYLIAFAEGINLKEKLKKIGVYPQPKKTKEQVEAEQQKFLGKLKHSRRRRAISCPHKDRRDPEFVAVEFTDAYNKWLSHQHLKGKCSKTFP